MARMPNVEIGFLPCFICSTRASLRKNASNALYYICPLCGGPIYGNGRTFQLACIDNATMHGEEGPPVKSRLQKVEEEKKKVDAPTVPQPKADKKPEVQGPKSEPKEDKPTASKGPGWGFQL